MAYYNRNPASKIKHPHKAGAKASAKKTPARTTHMPAKTKKPSSLEHRLKDREM